MKKFLAATKKSYGRLKEHWAGLLIGFVGVAVAVCFVSAITPNNTEASSFWPKLWDGIVNMLGEVVGAIATGYLVYFLGIFAPAFVLKQWAMFSEMLQNSKTPPHVEDQSETLPFYFYPYERAEDGHRKNVNFVKHFVCFLVLSDDPDPVVLNLADRVFVNDWGFAPNSHYDSEGVKRVFLLWLQEPDAKSLSAKLHDKKKCKYIVYHMQREFLSERAFEEYKAQFKSHNFKMQFQRIPNDELMDYQYNLDPILIDRSSAKPLIEGIQAFCQEKPS